MKNYQADMKQTLPSGRLQAAAQTARVLEDEFLSSEKKSFLSAFDLKNSGCVDAKSLNRKGHGAFCVLRNATFPHHSQRLISRISQHANPPKEEGRGREPKQRYEDARFPKQ